MRKVLREYSERLQLREQHREATGEELPPSHFEPLVVLFDEANNAKAAFDRRYGKAAASNPWVEFVKVLGSGARKVRISVLLLVQSANVEDLGISGGMRNNFTRIALDDLNIKRMVANEEFNTERKRALGEALAGLSYPATCVMGAEVYLLSREGLNTRGLPTNVAEAAWEASVRVRAGDEGGDELLEGLFRSHEPARTLETTPLNVLDRLRELRAAGVTRQQAREDLKLRFTDAQWTEAGKEAR